MRVVRLQCLKSVDNACQGNKNCPCCDVFKSCQNSFMDMSCRKMPACHANDLGSIWTRTEDFFLGVLTQKHWLGIFSLQYVAESLLVITRHNVCCRTWWIINYRPLIINQFQFQYERAQKTTSRREQLFQPSRCSCRHQHTELRQTYAQST